MRKSARNGAGNSNIPLTAISFKGTGILPNPWSTIQCVDCNSSLKKK